MTKRTIVFSRSKFEGQDWRRKRKILKNRPRWKFFRQKEQNSVPLQKFSKPVVSIFASSRVSKLQFWDRMHIWKHMFLKTCWGWGQSPAKSQRTMVRKDQLLHWRSLHNLVMYLKILIRESLFYVNKENWHRNQPSNSPRAAGAKLKFEKERVRREVLSKKCEPHERSPCAPKIEDRSHEETLHQEGCARRAAWDLAKIFTCLRIRTKLRFTLLLKQRWCRHSLRKYQRSENA